jgi:hypothetical protein
VTVLSQIIDENGKPYLLTQDSAGTPIIEPLAGYQTVDDVLDRFPDTIYNTNRDSHLYAFLNALCGDAGAGSLKQTSYVTRLQIEGNSLTFAVLDALFGDTFQFPRLPNEIYPYDPNVDVLTTDEWNAVAQADESYRNRASLFMQATRLGNTPAGIAQAASSASNISCDVFETYIAVWDGLSDDPLGLPNFGTTNSSSEFVVIARPDGNDPTFQMQIAVTPTGAAPAWVATTVYVLGDIVQPIIPNGHYYAVIAPTDGSNGTSGSSEPAFPIDGTTVTDGSTLIWEDMGAASFADNATSAPVAGSPPTGLDPATQRNILAVLDNVRPVGTMFTVTTAGLDLVPITMGDFQTLVSPIPNSSSNNYQIARFVTGANDVVWPTPDNETAIVDPTTNQVTAPANRTNGFFIEAGSENEQNQLPLNSKDRINVYETIQLTRAYTDLALSDATYNTPDFYNIPTNLNKYASVHVGPGDSTVASIYPFLFNTPTGLLFDSSKAISQQFSPVTLERRAMANS